jgi:hypothetical protein
MSIHPIYLRVRPADIALIKFLFESYEGVGFVRTVDRREAVIVVLVAADFLHTAREILAALQADVDCEEVGAPLSQPDDWLMREIDTEDDLS